MGQEEADRLRVEGEQMREEWRRATGSAVEGHAELARRCKAADAEAASLRSEFEAKVGVAEAALAKALEAAAEAGAAAAAMEEERDALVEELRHGAREGEVAQLRRQLQEAEAEAAEGGIAKEKLVEAAWRYREQAAALQAQMRQEVEMCKEEAAAAAERGVQEAELRMSAESQVELLQGEVERLAGELEDVTEQLSASNAELAGLRAQGDLTSQLSELRQLRLELDEKTEWLKVSLVACRPHTWATPAAAFRALTTFRPLRRNARRRRGQARATTWPRPAHRTRRPRRQRPWWCMSAHRCRGT
mmetsp:Transcript_10097/g.25846  ORF Transcript_10097/g.25846 Transcript_10097/m.25846 type:complete len:304 (+) Transcript_10097:253-1164(+)